MALDKQNDIERVGFFSPDDFFRALSKPNMKEFELQQGKIGLIKIYFLNIPTKQAPTLQQVSIAQLFILNLSQKALHLSSPQRSKITNPALALKTMRIQKSKNFKVLLKTSLDWSYSNNEAAINQK